MYATPTAVHHALPPKPVFDTFPRQSPPLIQHSAASTPPRRSFHDTASNLICYGFSVPFPILTGPNRGDIVYATPKSNEWLQPEGGFEPAALVYRRHLKELEDLCLQITNAEEYNCRATLVMYDKTHPGFKGERKKLPFVASIQLVAHDINVILHIRGLILRSCPVALKTACVDLDSDRYSEIIGQHLDTIAKYTGTDMFVLKPHESKAEAAGDPEVDASQGTRYKIKIYGDHESVEHAKTRVLTMIDDLLGHTCVDFYMDLSIQSLMCGRGRKNIKLIESATNTAIYFPPMFPMIYGYTPKGAHRRHPDQLFITGNNPDDLKKAQRMLQSIMTTGRPYLKATTVSFNKIDYMLLERLDEIKKITEANGTFIQFPQLGSAQSNLRVQGLEMLHIERTLRSIMNIAGQYYLATWWIHADAQSPHDQPDIQRIISDVSACCGIEIVYRTGVFEMVGSDDAIKRALDFLDERSHLGISPGQIRVKIELANEHKEFVAGKKNGKVNKIMTQSQIQILFDGFGDYNFNIDVGGQNYDQTMQGLELVEQELPAAMSFHVPDSYHKRIIGVGGQHIQTIMKKYSVFVKFSNAMERGTNARADNEDLKVDNVICRTPARNAANLEAVKAEIMEMVQQADAEIVTENVEVPRLHHRSLMAQRDTLERLESKWGCSISFPNTEQASDLVTIKGPEWQIPHFKGEFLELVPETHHIKMKWSDGLEKICDGIPFQNSVVEPMKKQFGIDMEILGGPFEVPGEVKTIQFSYTRNNAGFLQDAIELLSNHFITCGEKAELVKGRLSRPKSDSFEDFAPFFPSAVHPKTSSQDDLLRPGSRLSGDMGSILGDKGVSLEPGTFADDSETREAFYNGDRRRSSVVGYTMTSRPPGSSGSGSSSRHSRAASLDSDWEKLSRPRM